MNTLKYILRHGWLWPLEFWLRPFAVHERIIENDRIEENNRKELSSSLSGATLAGILLAVLFWWTGKVPAEQIWSFAVAVALAVAVAGAFAFAGAGAFAFAGVYAGVYAFAGVYAGAFTGLAIIGIISGKVSYGIFVMTSIIVYPVFGFKTFTELTTQEVNVSGLPLSLAITIGILSGIIDQFRSKPLNTVTQVSKNQLFVLVIFCWLPALAAWFNPFGSELLQNKLHLLALYLFATPIIASGFLTLPLLLPVAGWLYRPVTITRHTTPSSTPLIHTWQSCSLPLPRLKQYLAGVMKKDIELGYETLRTVQTQTFQGMAARKAAQLVLNDKEGLAFAGYLANKTNPATLHQILYGSPFARSVAILSSVEKQKEIKEKDELLSIYEKRSQKTEKALFQNFLQRKTDTEDPKEILHLSKQPLSERLTAARSFLAQSQECTGKEEYSSLLKTLETLSTPEDFQQLSQNQPHEFTPENTSWLQGGWQIVSRLEKNRTGILQAYQSLSRDEAKKTYLGKQQERLKAIDWSDLPWFWTGIAKELVDIWDAVYEQEIKETREWLLLEISPETDMLRPGNATLTLGIDNKSNAIAQQIHLTVEEQGNIIWVSRELNVPDLLQGQGSSELRLDLRIEQPGRYVINGTLTALDLDERPYEWPVNFVLHADEKGQPYHLAKKQYYVVGPRLNSDLLFIGRKQLLRDISLLWQNPANKEALLLIGLRRMGKSSLLEKIHRDGLNDNDKVIPLLVDLQGKASQHSFLQAVVEAMTTKLDSTPPKLDRTDPGLAFEQFLHSLLPQLADRYFLLMIDEANFFAHRDYGELPHLLRSMMQAPDVPLLLLFCGTYELRQGARDYDSILYNTTRTKNVSYFNPTESAEVLTRPVKDFLEYDPQALRLAFQLTHGHPLLLQALGDQLIQTFNDTILAGKKRSNYVTYGDMEQAGQQLSRKENPAFGNYWEDANFAQQKALVVMAASLDETSRKRGSLEYLLAQAAELRIPLERKEGFKALDQLSQEEQLIYADGGYSFMVALYRRWILWYYPPERFRESL